MKMHAGLRACRWQTVYPAAAQLPPLLSRLRAKATFPRGSREANTSEVGFLVFSIGINLLNSICLMSINKIKHRRLFFKLNFLKSAIEDHMFVV